MNEHDLIPGVCCAVCRFFECDDACQMKTASPWSRHRSFCHEYEPNRMIPEAVTLEVGIARKFNQKEKADEG